MFAITLSLYNTNERNVYSTYAEGLENILNDNKNLQEYLSKL
jgi:hypothetical protein